MTERRTIHLVAGGLIILRSGSPSREWYKIPKNTDLANAVGAPPGEALIYGGKMKNGPAGIVRALKVDPAHPGTVFGTPGTYVGEWGDDEWKAQINLEDRAIREELAALKRERKAKRDDPLLRILEPLQRMYNRMGGSARAQLIARVVHELQKGGRL